MKYAGILQQLEDTRLYTPATIADFALALGLLSGNRERTRVRVALIRFARTRRFPEGGDGLVTLRGQSPTPGWYGKRWKKALS